MALITDQCASGYTELGLLTWDCISSVSSAEFTGPGLSIKNDPREKIEIQKAVAGVGMSPIVRGKPELGATLPLRVSLAA